MIYTRKRSNGPCSWGCIALIALRIHTQIAIFKSFSMRYVSILFGIITYQWWIHGTLWYCNAYWFSTSWECTGLMRLLSYVLYLNCHWDVILSSFRTAFSFSVGLPSLTNVLGCSSAFLAARKFISFSSTENRTWWVCQEAICCWISTCIFVILYLENLYHNASPHSEVKKHCVISFQPQVYFPP